MAAFNKKWKKAEANITKRGIFMFNNKLLSDVSLVVGASSDEGVPKKSKVEPIPARKFVLSICSPVFFAMFCGELAERSDCVDLPDCEYEGVLEMLRYMYSGKVELKESNVMQVLLRWGVGTRGRLNFRLTPAVSFDYLKNSFEFSFLLDKCQLQILLKCLKTDRFFYLLFLPLEFFLML